jgi:uncharacterized membrane protein
VAGGGAERELNSDIAGAEPCYRCGMSLMKAGRLFAVHVMVCVAIGCGGDDDDHEGQPTGAECPPASSLTYDDFGREFMTEYCVRCHASTLSGAARNGAPSDHDFDTVEGVRLFADHIDEVAAAGPDATNTEMPPSGPAPSQAEREQLGEWLACGAP